MWSDTRISPPRRLTCLWLAALLLLAGLALAGCTKPDDQNSQKKTSEEQEKNVVADQPVEHHIYLRNGQIEDADGNAAEAVHVYQNDIVFWHNEESNQIKINFRQDKKLFGVLKVILYPGEEPLQLHVRSNADFGDHEYDPELDKITMPGPKIVVDPPN